MAAPTVLMKCGGMTNLSVIFAVQLPLGRGAKGCGSFSWARPYGGELARSA